ncbi:hypothetical protein Dsin_016168 [Dipteronia sinensis]|uniref:RNase H type-1 domain-containing protein n=1 Tax=Dipteronia sinensis TaxID=43782 RepID=A0AAE0E5G6_9ROSI|nr:hypothetical protein Dsin_016168 [Dipteronia sinensis]
MMSGRRWSEVQCACSAKILGMFCAYVGILDSNSTEILAIHKATTLCASSSSFVGKEIDIVCDSKVAVSWVNTRVIFNPRSSNSYADMLAKKGSGMEGDSLIWEVH